MKHACPALFLTIALFLFVPQASAQAVDLERYELGNGMTVILHEDHSLPVVTINTWFRVGSKEEAPGRSGFAHLFEHLMFMGTERVPGNQFDVLMETGGGRNNASTSFDRTNYYSSGPASLLPTLLWLDADRLEDLARTMTTEKLDLQRDVVRNERRQSIENVPYGKAELQITELMFPAGHPYHYEVIGTHADLEAATLQNVTDFFATFYVPNNASLVVAGDFESAAVKPLIEKLFGSLPRGADPMHQSAAPVHLGRVVRAVTLDQVELPKLCMAYHAPAELSEGQAELELLANVLADGKSSRLYRRLVLEEQIAAEVSAYVSAAKLQSIFRIDVVALPGVDLGRIETVVDEELARLQTGGIAPAELEQRKATVEHAKLSELESVAAKADKLNEYLFHWGDPQGFQRDLERYRKATPQSVVGWAKQVLTPDSRLLMRVLPTEPEPVASARDQRPQDFAPKAFTPPAPQSFALANGLPVLLWTRPELPLASMRIVFTSDVARALPAQAGSSELAAQMLQEGTGALDAEAFAAALQALGADFSVDVAWESAQVSLSALKRNLWKAAELAEQALRAPRMAPEDFERVRGLHLEDLKQQASDPRAVASRVGLRLFWGDASPYAWPVAGTPSTVATLDLAAVDQRRRDLFHPSRATLLVSGDLTRAEAERELNRIFGAWKRDALLEPRSLAGRAAGSGLRLALVDRPDAVQTMVNFVFPGTIASDSRRSGQRVLNVLLGGSFTSRLNQNLREKNGYTYGARSSFNMQASGGWLTAGAAVRADATGEALREFLNEFIRLGQKDVSVGEAAKARESYRTNVIEGFEGNDALLDSFANVLASGLPIDSIASDLASLEINSAERLNTLAQTCMALNDTWIVLVGDRETILAELEGLGLPVPLELNASGTPLE